MKFWIKFCLLVLSWNFGQGFNNKKEKRLLLNDPNAISSEINTLQETVRTQRHQLDLQRRDMDTLKAQVTILMSIKDDIQKISTAASGSTFIVWGKKACPIVNNTYTIYSGVTGGGLSSEKGNGGNPLCLPHKSEPTDYQIVNRSPNSVGRVYGSEYQFANRDVASDDDVPCALCEVNHSTSTIMIPAKVTCPSQWRKQYSGFMVSSYHGYSQSEYICMHDNPEYIDGTRSRHDSGLLFYPVVTVCGSLPCPPYQDSTHLSCVVCSK